eukprot:m51a1_g12014 hypothetical protein (140) ;mRNA; r:152-733
MRCARLLMFLAAAAVAVEAVPVGGRVLLSEVRALTLRRGAMTAGRRSAPVPQLVCSRTPDPAYEPSVVQCLNRGPDSTGNIQWKCEAELDSAVQFDELDVSCEGYESPDDPYILAGSCGLTYSLRPASPRGPSPSQHAS